MESTPVNAWSFVIHVHCVCHYCCCAPLLLLCNPHAPVHSAIHSAIHSAMLLSSPRSVRHASVHSAVKRCPFLLLLLLCPLLLLPPITTTAASVDFCSFFPAPQAPTWDRVTASDVGFQVFLMFQTLTIRVVGCRRIPRPALVCLHCPPVPVGRKNPNSWTFQPEYRRANSC